MHKNFGEWYRNISLTVDGETLKKRWTGVESAAVEPDSVREMIRLAFSDQVSPDSETKFRTYFQESDAAFRMKDNDAELSLLAGAVLIDLFEKGYEDSEKSELLAAIGCISADLMGLRRKHCHNPELVAEANRFLEKTSKARADWTSLASADAEITDLKKVLAVTAEETNILWWLFGESSRDSGKSFQSHTVESLALVVSKELSELTQISPGAISIDAVLDRALAHGKGDKRSTHDVIDFFKAVPLEWPKGKTAMQAEWTAICPLRSISVAQSADKCRTKLGIKKGAKLSSKQVAMQLYWEFQWDQVWRQP